MSINIEEPKAQRKYDVAVIGGGTTGCCAAIAAAREGASVILIEKLPFLGGNMTGGLPWLGFHEKNSGRQIVSGIPFEIIQTLRGYGGATEFVFDPICGSAVGVNGSMLKVIIEKMTSESGVMILLHSIVCGAVRENGVYRLELCTKGGAEFIYANVVVDCTDSGDAAQLAGAVMSAGRAGDHKRQVSSYVFTVGGIDPAAMLEYFNNNLSQIRPYKLSEDKCRALVEQMETAPVWVLGAFPDIIAKARANGTVYHRDRLIAVVYQKWNELVLASSRIEDVDPNDVFNHSAAELEGARQALDIFKLLRDYIPGCENARMISTGAQTGMRETNHIVGEYTLTAQDMLFSVKFEDAICCGAYHMDIHSPDHDGLESRQPPVYQIPYRSLIVKGLENILVAGRCICATHEAMSSTRVAPISAAQGQAAGTAAAIAALKSISLREISVSELQEVLIGNGAILC